MLYTVPDPDAGIEEAASLPARQRARAPKKQSPSARRLLDQKLAITDHQIDALVYELYGLTGEEITIVES